MGESLGGPRRSPIREMFERERLERMRREACSVAGCDRRLNRDIRTLPLCYEHGLEVAKKYELRILADANRRNGKKRAERIERRQTRAGNREGSLVYYVRIGDYIKIGYSERLRNRFTTLRADELLAVEPGGAELERERHVKFAEERIDLRRENFRPTERLNDHIAELLAEHGLPRWATLPRTSIVTHRKEIS